MEWEENWSVNLYLHRKKAVVQFVNNNILEWGDGNEVECFKNTLTIDNTISLEWQSLQTILPKVLCKRPSRAPSIMNLMLKLRRAGFHKMAVGLPSTLPESNLCLHRWFTLTKILYVRDSACLFWANFCNQVRKKGGYGSIWILKCKSNP